MKQAKRLPRSSTPRVLFRAVTLLHQMLAFVQDLQYYTTEQVLEPTWAVLEKRLAGVRQVD